MAAVAVGTLLASGAAAYAGTLDTSVSPAPAPAAPAAAAVKAHPMFMWTIANQWSRRAQPQAITPIAPPCPESGTLPSPFSNCGLPEFPAVGEPYPGNMAYWGGHVQVTPHVYVVYFGWGEPGAFVGLDRGHPPRVAPIDREGELDETSEVFSAYDGEDIHGIPGGAVASAAEAMARPISASTSLTMRKMVSSCSSTCVAM